ncbi:hypothetical protein niasHT_031044 [Heterodera trifolii]|uniref:Uncharacterized protein n=1 Tax=Heterodera trifolii TaxID=157864 RepID=A0ABD2IF72_9BILA
MSDHNTQEEEMPKLKKRCFLCNDVLFNVFTLVSNKVILGTRLALVSGQFDAIVDKLLSRRSREWSLGILELRCAQQQQGEGKVPQIYKEFVWNFMNPMPPCREYAQILKEVPIATVPVHQSVTGFQGLTIRYLDKTLVKFIENFSPLFKNNKILLFMQILSDQAECWQIVAKRIWPLLMNNIDRIICLSKDAFVGLRKFVSPTVLRDCANLHCITSTEFFPKMLPDDRFGSSPAQALSAWLHAPPSSDGRPKVFCYASSKKVTKHIESIKELFYVATTPATYIIGLLYNSYNGETFMVENKRTNERLTLRHYMSGGWCVLTRGPLDWEKKQWAPWEFASVDFGILSSSYVKIRLSDYNASGLSAEEDDEN